MFGKNGILLIIMGIEEKKGHHRGLYRLRSPIMPVLKELALNPDYRNSDGTFSPGNMRVLGALQEATGRS